MHEEALLRDLRRKLQEVARVEGDLPIRRVRLWVGALAHVTPTALRLRWPEVVAGTPAEGGRLEIDVSEDTADPDAQGIRLVELTVDDERGRVPEWPHPATEGRERSGVRPHFGG
ncbi:MAG: hydrogenase maturation nickel metallochaperone HypA [Thermoplasmata archaeon]|nr:hydrogenase maturation nickel metallochaperone HypA [Thermoplasmata archaeon]